MELIDGKLVSSVLKKELAAEVTKLLIQGHRAPHLVAVLVGDDGASETYVNNKDRSCKEVGFQSTVVRLDKSLSETELLHTVHKLNQDPGVDGFIVQLPLPVHINEQKIIEAISPTKDVDGFHPVNIGKMVLGLPTFLPATPFGIIQLLEYYHIETYGKHCVIVGRSNIVGTPMALLLSRKTKPGDCTVTLCHSRTRNLEEHIRRADIIIMALGQPEFLKGHMVKEGAIVIDVGTTRLPSEKTKSGWKLFGDVDFSEVAPKCAMITPVPGGVGPMTIISLLQNTLRAYQQSHKIIS